MSASFHASVCAAIRICSSTTWTTTSPTSSTERRGQPNGAFQVFEEQGLQSELVPPLSPGFHCPVKGNDKGEVVNGLRIKDVPVKCSESAAGPFDEFVIVIIRFC